MQIQITLVRYTKELIATAEGDNIYGTITHDLRSVTRVKAVDLWIRDRCGGWSNRDYSYGMILRPDSDILTDAVMVNVYLSALLDKIVHEAMTDWNNAKRK